MRLLLLKDVLPDEELMRGRSGLLLQYLHYLLDFISAAFNVNIINTKL
jgi:hypothetical protein